MQVKLTHRGWFGVCPIHIDNPDADAPVLIERHWAFQPLFALSEFMYAALNFLAETLDPHFEPHLPVMITGKLDAPIVLDLEFDDV